MSNEMTDTAVPKLRFPEFAEAGEWEERNLGQAGEFIGGGTPETSKSEYWDGEIQWFTPTEIKDRFHSKSKRTITAEGLRNSSAKMLPKGALLLTTRATIGEIAIAENPCTTNQGFQSFVVNSTEDNSFWYYWFIQHKGELVRRASGSTFPEIGKTQIIKIPALSPNKAEQQKIAATLSSLDDLLTAHSAKLAALQAHKRGLMQGLFPAEGETVPKLRFPEFREAGEWEEKKLGNLIEIKGRIGYRGYTVEDIVKKGEGAISLSPSNISDEGNLTFSKATFISWEKYDESPEIMLEDGFTVLVKTGSTYGKAAFVKNLPEKTTVNPQIVVLKPISINSVFLFLLVCNTAIQNQIEAHVVGGAIPTLAQGSVIQFDILVPNESEQKKIADCLSSLDNRITAQTQQIEALKLHKKGLMQGLFPAAAEPTA